jgi:2-polyprenyl-3-methyl-5-hydroxy-6-metoxy-1,4-benzoquinol methylase
MKNNKMDKEEIMKKINSVNWFHKFELCPGIVTPGKRAVNAKSFLDKRKIPSDLTGLKTLDIGTFDGPLSFELESRGAKSFAMDIQDPNVTGFNVAKEILDSDVDYKQGTVYDLKEMYGEEFFDIVCFKGVYYHLKNPVGAFEQVAAVLKTGGLCLLVCS